MFLRSFGLARVSNGSLPCLEPSMAAEALFRHLSGESEMSGTPKHLPVKSFPCICMHGWRPISPVVPLDQGRTVTVSSAVSVVCFHQTEVGRLIRRCWRLVLGLPFCSNFAAHSQKYSYYQFGRRCLRVDDSPVRRCCFEGPWRHVGHVVLQIGLARAAELKLVAGRCVCEGYRGLGDEGSSGARGGTQRFL